MWCAPNNYKDILCKRFLDTNFNEAVINKISNFHQIAPNLTYSQKNRFLFTYNKEFNGPTASTLSALCISWQWHVKNLLLDFFQL